MKQEISEPRYFSVVPASVRYAKNFSTIELALYAEIEARSDGNGICYLTLEFLENLYFMPAEVLGSALIDLEEAGFICIAEWDVKDEKSLMKIKIER